MDIIFQKNEHFLVGHLIAFTWLCVLQTTFRSIVKMSYSGQIKWHWETFKCSKWFQNASDSCGCGAAHGMVALLNWLTCIEALQMRKDVVYETFILQPQCYNANSCILIGHYHISICSVKHQHWHFICQRSFLLYGTLPVMWWPDRPKLHFLISPDLFYRHQMLTWRGNSDK